jgi:hypothetical protein
MWCHLQPRAFNPKAHAVSFYLLRQNFFQAVGESGPAALGAARLQKFLD